ncbi:uncharacterized protein V1516DRAFT_242206 [Lipomyces oligophaga]|uniref:uncharacterized protein n=1 Tax=Lipomyces oligophaga TaxID=45792 RepID=UPI0034CE48E1
MVGYALLLYPEVYKRGLYYYVIERGGCQGDMWQILKIMIVIIIMLMIEVRKDDMRSITVRICRRVAMFVCAAEVCMVLNWN